MAAGRRGERPRIADHLSEEDPTGGQLLVELVYADLEFRLRRGEAAGVEDYLREHPALASRPDDLVGLRALAEGFRRGAAARPAGHAAAEGDGRAGAPEGPNVRLEEFRSSFEREWMSGKEPSIESFLDGVTEPERTTLFLRLLTTEVSLRRSRGERPASDDYAARFPEYRARLGEVEWPPVPESTVIAPTHAGPGRRFDHFELLEQVGAGGFGTVWKARDLRLGRLVAVKVPHPHRLSEDARRLFLREARAAARLRHPNVVAIHEAKDDGGVAYIVYDFVEGVSLQQRLTGGRPSPRDAAVLCEKLARAVHHANASGIVHRDLKPGNVLIDHAGEPHITDFGLAKGAAGDETVTREGHVMGSLPYMSPEQAAGRSHEADARTDVYGLGVILYELLTGRRPFQGSEGALLHQIIAEDPPPPRRVDAGVPRDLETICLKAIAKEPSRRFPFPSDLADELRRYLEGRPILSRRAGPVEQGRRWVRRRARALTLLAGGSLASAAVMILLLNVPAVRRQLAQGDGPEDPDPLFPAAAAPDAVPDGSESLKTRPVVFRTLPPADDLWLFERIRRTGWYLAGAGERIPTRPAAEGDFEADLRPGEYLVVAVRGDDFVEVPRWVPYPDRPDEVYPALYRGLFWIVAEGKVRIDVPTRPVRRGELVRFPASEIVMGYQVGEDADRRPVFRRRRLAVPAFDMARDEFRWEDQREAVRDGWPWIIKRGQEFPADHAMTAVSFDEAASLLEFAGMRMPDEAEWYAAAEAGPALDWRLLRRQTPENDFGPVGVPASDLTGRMPGVRGLHSGVAEWTRSWGVPTAEVERAVAGGWKGGIQQLFQQPRAVRGSAPEVVNGDHHLPDGFLSKPQARDPRLRLSIARGAAHFRGLGFRGVRSVRPPRGPEDFVRDLGPADDDSVAASTRPGDTPG